MNTPRDTRTATEAYSENTEAIRAAIRKLQAGLRRHKTEQAKSPRNWGFVGDTGHVLELVERTARFVCGEEE